MNKLTIGEIEDMKVETIEKIMTSSEAERMHKLGFAEYETFLGLLKDEATLSGLEENDLFVTIDEFLAHLEEKQKEFDNTENQMVVKNENELSNNFKMTNNIVKPEIITNINDKKQIFNLGKHVDKLLNDCEGQVITIDKILIKKYLKPLDTPIVNPETGEIVADTKTSMSVVIVDDKGVSYATGSKTFGYTLMNCIYEFGDEMKGLKIKIIKTQRAGAKNKSLDFEIL